MRKSASKISKLPPDHASGALSALNILAARNDYRATVPKLFPSDQSLYWFIRKNKKKLEEANALVPVNRRIFIHPEKFDAVVLEVARAQVAKAA